MTLKDSARFSVEDSSSERTPIIVCGRIFSSDDLLIIRRIIEEEFDTSRTYISRQVCRRLSWYKPDGGLKEMSCRVALLRLWRAGVISLPPPRRKNPNERRITRRVPAAEPQSQIVCSVKDLLPITLKQVTTRWQSELWNDLIDRYHYLGHTPLPGAQIRYLIESPERLLGAIGFSAAAWKTKPRDDWIGWADHQRKANLGLIVNNSRFLIVPWVISKNLASKILSLSAKIIPRDWQKLYGYEPVLFETFVEKGRFAGTCYRAANWHRVGSTKGRGKLDRFNEYKLPVKDIFLYPLRPDFRIILTSVK